MKSEIRCTWCGQITHIIWIHGHGQCARCQTNIDECCRGESGSDNIFDDSE